MDWYLNVLKSYLDFDGRARRREYWMLALANIIFTFMLSIPGRMFDWERAGGEDVLVTIYGVLVFIPWWTVQFRCLYGADRSVWQPLVLLIPIVGWLVIVTFSY